jgi:bifunctional non-homologous end joining protein LigD
VNIAEYRESKIDTKVTADIAERWQKRVVVRGLDKQGRNGALAYLDSYGKRIGAKKVVKLAAMAESVGAKEFASVMWEKAFNLETGQHEQLEPNGDDEILAQIVTPEDTPIVVGLPNFLQPGKIATLQPQDAIEDVDFYLQNDEFIVQPKIDGYRLLAICTPDGIHYQKRSLGIQQSPSATIHGILEVLTENLGMMILDGELYWQDYLGLEHRTAAQAATANVKGGHPETLPEASYAIFDCLFYDSEDITKAPFTYRTTILHTIGEQLKKQPAWDGSEMTSQDIEKSPMLKDNPLLPYVEILYPVSTTDAKTATYKNQQASGREGVVFRDITQAYRAGKDKTAFRVKFLDEHVLEVTNLTATDAEGRLFGAMETELGLVGTGFSADDQSDIMLAMESGPLWIEVVSQGLTENGKLWHPRFIKIAEVP